MLTIENQLEYPKERAKTLPPNHKTALCANYALKKKCYHGSNCSFAHSTAEQIESANTTRSRLHKTKICPNLSNCVFGKNCNFAHKAEEIIRSRNRNTAASAPIPEIILAAIPAAHLSYPDPVLQDSMPDMLVPAKSAHPSTQILPSIPELAQAEPMDMLATADVLGIPIPLITPPEVAVSKVPSQISPSFSSEAADLIKSMPVNDLLDKSPPFSFTLPGPVRITPVKHQYKHSSHPKHVLYQSGSTPFKCSVCRVNNINQGRHKCSTCAWNACQKCMEQDFLSTIPPATVPNTATPTPRAPVFIAVDPSQPVPSSPFLDPKAQRAHSVSPQQLSGNPNTSSHINAPKAACLAQHSPPSGAKTACLVQLESTPRGAHVDDCTVK